MFDEEGAGLVELEEGDAEVIMLDVVAEELIDRDEEADVLAAG